MNLIFPVIQITQIYRFQSCKIIYNLNSISYYVCTISIEIYCEKEEEENIFVRNFLSLEMSILIVPERKW